MNDDWPKAEYATEPDMIEHQGDTAVLVIRWPNGRGYTDEQAYGPWTIREDGSHLTEISTFYAVWQETHAAASSATIYAVQSPETALARTKEPR